MRGCHVICASMHQRVPYEKTQELYLISKTHKRDCFCKRACAIVKYALENSKNEKGNQNNKMIAISLYTMQRKRISLPEMTVTIHRCHGSVFFLSSPLVASRKSTFNHETKTKLHFTSPHPWPGPSCSVLDPSLIALTDSAFKTLSLIHI